ncbi:beta-1,6-N-acetylglucosaminyltransferase [Mannheimia haemolytica]|nr:beta-1,6-N-acetylglucosaminyltransferase [Mannheimia haemolytica]
MIFIDAKVEDRRITDLKARISALNLISMVNFTDRISVNWGDYSQIQVEMLLFKKAHRNSSYAYYHLLSGVDLPLVSQDTIHQFFDKHQGKEFLTIVSKESFERNKIYDRVRIHYWAPHISERTFSNKLIGKFFQKFIRSSELYMKRICSADKFKTFGTALGYASQWVSITDELVTILLDEELWIRDVFSHSLFCDELFIPTIINKYGWESRIYYSKGMVNDPEEFQGNLRYINWWDGSPYTWTDSSEDFSYLEKAINRGHFFARKFDIQTYPAMIDFIKARTQFS